jgi:hypothetical protein
MIRKYMGEKLHQLIGVSRRLVALTGSAALLAGGIVALTVSPAWAAAIGGSGASLPYVEVQAENSNTNGTVIGPSRAS